MALMLKLDLDVVELHLCTKIQIPSYNAHAHMVELGVQAT